MSKPPGRSQALLAMALRTACRVPPPARSAHASASRSEEPSVQDSVAAGVRCASQNLPERLRLIQGRGPPGGGRCGSDCVGAAIHLQGH